MRRIVINDKGNNNGLEIIAAGYLPADNMQREMNRMGMAARCLGVKGGGRDADDMRENMTAKVVVETDTHVFGFGAL